MAQKNHVLGLVRVAILGTSSPVCDALLYALSMGEALDSECALHLVLHDDPASSEKLRKVRADLLAAACELVQDVTVTTELDEALTNADVVILLQSAHRSVYADDVPTATRFVIKMKNIGEALERAAKRDVLVVVVGCPALLNAWLCSQFAPSLRQKNFTAVTRLDLISATSYISAKLKVAMDKVNNVTVWGDSSSSLIPDADNAVVQMDHYDQAMAVKNALGDERWLKDTFVSAVRQHWLTEQDPCEAWPSAIAQACCQHIRDLWQCIPTEEKWTCAGVASDGSYDLPRGTFTSLPVSVPKRNHFAIVTDIPMSTFTKRELRYSAEKIKKEQKIIYDICKEIQTDLRNE